MNNEDKLKQCVNAASVLYYQIIKDLFPDVPSAAIDYISDEADKVVEQGFKIFKSEEDIEMLYRVLVKSNVEGLTKDFLKKYHSATANMEQCLQKVISDNEGYLESLFNEGEVH